jgi:hypothetical protein
MPPPPYVWCNVRRLSHTEWWEICYCTGLSVKRRYNQNKKNRMLQSLRSKIRLNFVGPSQVRIRVRYSYPILDFRITNIRYYNKYWGGSGGRSPPENGNGGSQLGSSSPFIQSEEGQIKSITAETGQAQTNASSPRGGGENSHIHLQHSAEFGVRLLLSKIRTNSHRKLIKNLLPTIYKKSQVQNHSIEIP